MTDCSLQLSLSPLPRKPIWVRNDGGALSSDAGALLLRETDERLGLAARLAGCLTDRRDPARVRHGTLALLRQRIYQIACGYEDANDADYLRADPGLKLAVGRAPGEGDLASQPTLSRLENGVGPQACYRLSEALLSCYQERHRPSAPARLVLDVDATHDPTHGQQQLSFFHGYYDTYCYLPLLIFAQREGAGEQELLAAVLRPGNRHAGHKAMAILERVADRLRRAFPDTQLELRADSGLALPEVYQGCERLGVPYTISLPKNGRLLALAQPFLEQARQEHAQSGETARVFGEFEYAAESWAQKRRVIVKAEVTAKGENPRFVVTSRRAGDPASLYCFYAKRGDPENRIKELKDGLKADRLSCHCFWANQFRLLLHGAAYLLLQAMRWALQGTELACAQVETLRLRLLKVGARVVESARRVWVHLPSAYPWAYLWPRLSRAGPG